MSVATSPPPALERGAQIAPGYLALEHLSRGRSLDVYDAWSQERGCRCVVKLVRPDRAGDRGPRARLVREGRLLARLTHPHIVRGYEVLADPPAVVMETLAGQTLAHMIDEGERLLRPAELGHLGLHLASALRYLHANGYLHLDLKPSNVVAESGRATLIDMSLVRRPGRAPAGVGTWCYMAPEQARGGVLGPEADVWGLGVVLHEAATGEPTFDEPPGTPSEDSGMDHKVYPQLDARAPPLSRVRRRLPRALTGLVDACLDPDPDGRPTVAAALAALETIADLPAGERRFQDRGAAPAGPGAAV